MGNGTYFSQNYELLFLDYFVLFCCCTWTSDENHVTSVPNVIQVQVAAMRISIGAWSFYNVIPWDQLRKAWNTLLYDIRYSLIGLQKSETNCNKPFTCFMACNADGVGGDQLIAFCRYRHTSQGIIPQALIHFYNNLQSNIIYPWITTKKRRPLCTHPIPAFLHLIHTQNSLNFRHKNWCSTFQILVPKLRTI